LSNIRHQNHSRSCWNVPQWFRRWRLRWFHRRPLNTFSAYIYKLSPVLFNIDIVIVLRSINFHQCFLTLIL
jgi:hypothetical protein